MLEFLVGCGGGDEEAFLVAAICQFPFFSDKTAIVIAKSGKTYPAVNRPTILVPAIVAWQMGITSWSSASKTLSCDHQ